MAGRPKLEINKEMFERACLEYRSQAQIADLFHCNSNTINNWCKRTYGMTYTDYVAMAREKGSLMLLDAAFDVAINLKNPTMLIFLLKNFCGLSDNPNSKIVDNGEMVDLIKTLQTPRKAKNGTD